VRANRAYRLIVSRGGRVPAIFADPERLDRVEVVEIETGEVVLYWDCPVREASRRIRELRRSLAQLEAAEFMAHWQERAEE
jgi:hypothetical protein